MPVATATESAPMAFAPAMSLGVSPMTTMRQSSIGSAELRRAPARAGHEQRGPVDGVVAEAPEGEAVVDANAAELDLGAFAHVAGAQSQRDPRPRLGHVQRALHPRVNANRGAADFLGQDVQVEPQGRLHLGQQLRFAGERAAEPEQTVAHDGLVGHATERKGHDFLGPVAQLEGALHGAPTGAAARDQGSVDIEQQDGRFHGR